MNKSRKVIGVIAAAAFGVVGARAASADVIVAQWSFPTLNAGPLVSPAADTGTGTGVMLGMNNSFTYGGSETTPTNAAGDIVSTPGTAFPTFVENTWRVRGTNNKKGQPGNGWNTGAPNYTQGAAFSIPTTGYTPTSFTFDWYCTTAGVANMQVRYTLDDTVGTGFNYGGLANMQAPGVADPGIVWANLGSVLSATPNDYYGGASGSPTNTFSLAGLPAGAANDPNFAIELVSVAPVGGDGLYQAASGGDYNNSSGNWRFGNVTLNGTAVPEPASASLLGLAGLGLLRRRRAR